MILMAGGVFNVHVCSPPLVPPPGEFSEKVFRGLDFVLAEAAKRGLRLILVLLNYWKVDSTSFSSPLPHECTHECTHAQCIEFRMLYAGGNQ